MRKDDQPHAPCAACGWEIPVTATTCPECGEDPDADEVTCRQCEGEGSLWAFDPSRALATCTSPPESWVRCKRCDGQRVELTRYVEEREAALHGKRAA
jgi:predicted RNA-binding Zn-ribbon protein involved in translation (DUF1610 family)